MARFVVFARIFIAAVTMVAGLAGSALSQGIGPSKEACDGLKSEQAALVAAGVPATMERGPEWARTNLDAKALSAIKRFIEVSEQITFGCEQLRPLNARIEQTEAEPKEVEVKDDDGADVKPVEPIPAKPKPVARPKAQPKTTAEVVDPPAVQPKPAVKASPKAIAKPKANDAYVAPVAPVAPVAKPQ